MFFVKTQKENFLTHAVALPCVISLDKLIHYLSPSLVCVHVCVYVCMDVFIKFYIYEECFQFWCDRVSLEEPGGKFQKIPPSHLAKKMCNNRHVLLNWERWGAKYLFFYSELVLSLSYFHMLLCSNIIHRNYYPLIIFYSVINDVVFLLIL